MKIGVMAEISEADITKRRYLRGWIPLGLYENLFYLRNLGETNILSFWEMFLR